jgi:predicted hydrocarbon binding protein
MKSVLEQNGGFFVEFEMLAEMWDALQQLFASGAVVIMATMARSCGKKLCRRIGNNVNIEKALGKLCETLGEWNWGEFNFSDINTEFGMGRFSVRNSFETRVKRVSNDVGCYFLSNFMAGFLSELFGKNVTVKEQKCASQKGEICEFVFQAANNGE